MKIEEAIKLVKEVTGMSLDWDDTHYEALQMAIKALEQKSCKDAVSRQAVLNTLNRMDSVLDENRTVESYKESLIACYNDLPPVTPTRKKGKWIPRKAKYDNAIPVYECSICHKNNGFDDDNYCPNCGAEMESEE